MRRNLLILVALLIVHSVVLVSSARAEVIISEIMQRTDPAHLFTFQLSPISVLSGDYNGDGKADAADYIIWRNTSGQVGDLAADGNGDHVVDALDYALWRQNYGNHSGSGSAAGVPEPTAFVLALVVGIIGATSNLKRLRR